MDLTLFRLLNAFAGHGALWDGVIVFFASYLQYVLIALLVVFAFWPARRFQTAYTAAIAAVIARYGVKSLLVTFIHRARPFVTLDSVRNLIPADISENLQSFPSGHAVFFFALAMAVYRYNKRWGTLFFIGATLMGIARVIAGIHWPGDIVGGALIGRLVGWLTVQLVPQFRRVLPSQK